jgi:transposase
LAAFAGLSPSQHQSGTWVRGRTRLSKRSNARIRKALYFPAIVAQQHNPILHNSVLRLLQAGKAKLAVIAAVMRKLLHLVYGILKSGQPFDPHYLTKHPAFA